MRVARYILWALTASLFCTGTLGAQSRQNASEEEPVQPVAIMVRGEVHDREVRLRWAASDPKTWKLLNQHGVRLERLTVFRDGEVLDEPELVELTGSLRPEETDAFKQAAAEYSFAAIIAQAVFGETFEVSSGGSVETMIAQSEDLQQRFSLALYAADLCYPAALAAGWGFEDLTVRRGEKYLYRVIPLTPEGSAAIEVGALFVDADRHDTFPAPLDFAGRFGDGSVMLSWNGRVQSSLYAAYIPERSTDGVTFTPITETPITRMDDSPKNQSIFYADSIENRVRYHYRLVGITPFGSRSAYSDTISGVGLPELGSPAFITRAVPDEEGGATIEWEFDPANEDLIESFTLERSDDDKSFSDLISPIDKKSRTVTAPDIPPTNYFAITANTITGRRMRSYTALVQVVDTLPPAIPTGLRAVADTTGVVTLTWNANPDKGRFGYRIYRGQTAEEELVPLNDIAHRDTVYIDSISVRTLNRKVFYAVTALDERYNQSPKSKIVELRRPEVVPPTPPLIRTVKVENGRNIVVWVSGGEDNLAGYDLWRQTGREGEFETLARIEGPETIEYTDEDVENDGIYIYRVYSRSEGGLLSKPSPDYRVTAISKSAKKVALTLEVASSRQRTMIVKWNAPVPDAVNIALYKKAGEVSFALLSDGVEAAGELEDTDVVPGIKYQYMLVVKSNGAPPATTVKGGAL